MRNNQGGYDGAYGGFGNDQGQGFGGGFNSPRQGGGFNSPVVSSQAKAKRSQRLIPCNVAQILQATETDGEFLIGDVVIHQVSVLGIVRRVEMSATNILYHVDDMSGPPIEVRQWIETDESSMDQQPTVYEENTYIKIAGNVRSFGGKRSIGPFRIVPVTDLNELTMHMAEVVQTHMLVSKMTVAARSRNFLAEGGNSFQTPVKGGLPGAGGMPNNGLTDIQTQVHQLITSYFSDEGISMNELTTELKGISRDSIRKAVEFLSSEGHIYSTIDDDHFKSTEG